MITVSGKSNCIRRLCSLTLADSGATRGLPAIYQISTSNAPDCSGKDLADRCWVQEEVKLHKCKLLI